MKTLYLLLITALFFTTCATQKSSTLVSCNYDHKKNQTDYLVFPYGDVSIPGEWYRTNYNSNSRQQFFSNSDNITIAVSFGPRNKYEFNMDNSKKGFDFVEAYYKWDSEYFENNYKMNQEKIEYSEKDNFIIWRAFEENEEGEYKYFYFLFGEKNGFVSNFSIMNTDKWTHEEKVSFLKEMYLGKLKNE